MCNVEPTTTPSRHTEDEEEVELIDITEVVDLTGNSFSSHDANVHLVDVSSAPSSSSREQNLRNLLLHRKRLAEELELNRSREEELRKTLLMRKKRRDE